jgi:hypothetical protein
MAFNPFHSFRKHQKAWFAGLTIMCMLTFVLCTGVGGDAASWLLSTFGGSGDAVARINGKKVYSRQLGQLRLDRLTANKFMIQAIATARYRHIQAVLAKLGNKITPQEDRMIRQMGAFSPSFVSDHLMRLIREKKITDIKSVMAYQKLAEEDAQFSRLVQQEGERYFAGGDNDEDLLEFLLWRDEADRQGIRIVESGVREEVEKATDGYLEERDWEAIEESLRRENKDLTTKRLLAALGEEFRVRLVQTAYLGYRPGLGNKPEYPLTPDQFWQYFKEKCSAMDVEVLPIPVEAFLSKVKGEPTERELRAIFQRGKDREKDPASDQPAFRRPRRVQIAWVTADANSPEYRKSARYQKTVKPQPALRQLMSLLNVIPGHAGLPTGLNYAALMEYDTNRFQYKLPSLTEGNFVLPFYLPREERAEDTVGRAEAEKRALGAAALVGQAVGGRALAGALGADPATLATIKFAYQARPIAEAGKKENRYVKAERTERAFAAATLALSPYAPLPMFPGVRPATLSLAGTWRVADNQERYIPLAAVRGQLVDKLNEKAARERILADMVALKKKIEEYRPADKDEPVRKQWVLGYIEDAARDDGLQTGATDRPEDSFEIAKDPPLAALKKASGKDKDFAKLFFDAEGRYVPKPLNVEERAFGDQQPFLYWKTAIEEAKSPASLGEVRDAVKRWWKFDQARKLARKAAEELAKKLHKESSDDDRRRLLKETEAELARKYGDKAREEIVTLTGVAPLKPKDSAAVGPATYKPFEVAEDKFQHPRKTWSDKILAMEKPGRVVEVLENAPGSVFYVATRVSEPQASRTAFVDAYKSHFDSRQRKYVRDKLWEQCQEKYADDFREQIVAQLKERAHFEDLRSREDREKAKTKAKTPARRQAPAFPEE